MKQFICFIFALIILTVTLCNACASPLNLFSTNVSQAGWKLRSDKYHMGSKTFQYQYSTGIQNKRYVNNSGNPLLNYNLINDAIDAWNSGTNSNLMKLSLASNNSTTQGHFTTTTTYCWAKITRYNVSNGEVYEWSISLGPCTEQWLVTGGNTALNVARRSIAHYLGYVYGLGELTTTQNIMLSLEIDHYNNFTPTSQDMKGMEVVTHAHTHPAYAYESYSQYSQINHKCSCSHCQAYYLTPHEYTYHAGQYICTDCGYVTTNPNID